MIEIRGAFAEVGAEREINLSVVRHARVSSTGLPVYATQNKPC
jgi:hypothetical protein